MTKLLASIAATNVSSPEEKLPAAGGWTEYLGQRRKPSISPSPGYRTHARVVGSLFLEDSLSADLRKNAPRYIGFSIVVAKEARVKSGHSFGFRQTGTSVAKNVSFFKEHRYAYDKNVQELDTYVTIRASVNHSLQGVNRLLDIGNGGVFDYETNIVHDIVALDLFLDNMPSEAFPPNVTRKTGSALDIPEPDGSFDGVLLSMLIHHLVDKTVSGSLNNVRCAVGEAFRVLRPGGRLIVLESCVPPWFYFFEQAVFPLASPLINATLAHPATLQYPAAVIAKILQEHSANVEVLRIPKGRWILQYGFKFPALLTPVSPYRFLARNAYRVNLDSQ
jgi:SAM-dependent methyltransferase